MNFTPNIELTAALNDPALLDRAIRIPATTTEYACRWREDVSAFVSLDDIDRCIRKS